VQKYNLYLETVKNTMHMKKKEKEYFERKYSPPIKLPH
jgi:hypothetical protein